MKRLLYFGGVFIVLLLLLGVADGETSHTPHSLSDEQRTVSVSYFQQEENPYDEAKDYLFDNAFADIPHNAISLDIKYNSKSKYLMRLLTYINELQKQTSRKKSSYHISDVCHSDAVDYYIYALRRILI